VQAPFDHNIAATLAAIDAGRALHHEGALGVMHLDLAGGDMHATARSASLAPRATSPIELRLVAWPDRGWGQLPARGLDVLATIATDAGHRDGPLVVTPAPQLAAIAGYVPATATEPARLVVNPIVLAALEPATSPTPASPTPAAIVTARTAPDTAGNPYSFYTSVAACASAQRTRCEACLPSATCTPVTHGGDGNAECTQFAADANDGYAAICIDLAVVIDSVDSCIAASAPACPRDRHATESLASLDNNADFVTDTTCAAALDTCLADIFGGVTSPHDASPGCADSSCDGAPNCDLGDGSCDGGSCDGGGADSGGDCSSGDSGGCSGDSGGDCSGDSGGDCGGGGGGDCSGDSGGDCSGGGGDCSGGGGDCGGGGGDCNAAGHHPRHGGGSTAALIWACLPLPFARLVRRRSVRRRANEVHA
jgi:hypothetical protein